MRRSWRALVVPATGIMLWWIGSQLGWFNRRVFPSPGEVVLTAFTNLGSGSYWLALVSSLTRMVGGFAIATCVGIGLGVALGGSRWVGRLAGPTFHAFRQVAVFAWIPLISAWFGGGESAKIAFIAIAASVPITLNTIEGVGAVTKEHVELARVLEIGRARFVLTVLIPSAGPHILTGMHLGLVTAWLATVGAEYFLQISPGVAAILIEGRALSRMDSVLFGIATIGVIGFGLASVVTAVERYLLRWRPAHSVSRL